jgi:hypothetical protein
MLPPLGGLQACAIGSNPTPLNSLLEQTARLMDLI